MVENILVDDKNINSVLNRVNFQGGIILRGKLDEILSEEFMPDKTAKWFEKLPMVNLTFYSDPHFQDFSLVDFDQVILISYNTKENNFLSYGNLPECFSLSSGDIYIPEKYNLTNGICKCLSSILGKSYSNSCAYDISKVVIEDLDSSRLLTAEEFLKKLKDNKIEK
ncbi:MAG: hypothetical protein QT05_C0041G0010 [archaeon GW2011_AR13]|nr:MAG: hypothetical protein QT05_C0041G0010 [archaeon GW2011_AR13]HIH63573.1 hypothetical protein [Nanoarchaeota archaeon]HIJ10172.1 hypothetical protein [Nanoarchaeota archaeon]